MRAVAFYCQTKPLGDHGRWSLRWAATFLKNNPDTLGVPMGKSTLHRILNANGLKPHHSRYFLHIADPDFFPKMERLVELYIKPPPFLFFFDECPNIQILKRRAPDLQTQTTRKRLEEFEYARNGTIDVFAFLEHSTGKVHAECHADHKSDTFLRAFRKHVASVPDAPTLHYVMDNLSSHVSFSFCQTIAELCRVKCPPKKHLDTQVKRAQWLQRPDKRIVIHFTPYHGSWLNFVEIWFGIMKNKLLRDSFGSAQEFRQALESLLDEWNGFLAHPFQWKYQGKNLHNSAVKRFSRMLQNVDNIEIRLLVKSFKLMSNLFRDYFEKVSRHNWQQLKEALVINYDDIKVLIENDERPVRKVNAKKALADLMAALEPMALESVA